MFTELASREPRNPVAQLYLIGCAIRRGDAKAIAAARESLQRLVPGPARGHAMAGAWLVAAGHCAEAQEEYGRALPAKIPGTAEFALAQCNQKVGNIDAALGLYRKALELNPELEERHLHLAFLLIGIGESGEAGKVLVEASRRFPTSVRIIVTMSLLHLELGYPDRARFVSTARRTAANAKVSLVTGGDRADMAFRALQPFAGQIRQAIGNRRVVLKPNNNEATVPLAATHVDTLEGVLEFFKSIKKVDNVVIAESGASAPTFEGFSNYGYFRVADKYPVKLINLDLEESELLHVLDERDIRPHPVRVSKMLLDSDSYVVSLARLKTHDRVVATLSLKNIVMGAPTKQPEFTWADLATGRRTSNKPTVHGGGYRGTNYNLYALAPHLHPHLSLIDGFQGMEGNGLGKDKIMQIVKAEPDLWAQVAPIEVKFSKFLGEFTGYDVWNEEEARQANELPEPSSLRRNKPVRA